MSTQDRKQLLMQPKAVVLPAAVDLAGTSKPAAVEQLLRVIDEMQRRIVELETKTANL